MPSAVFLTRAARNERDGQSYRTYRQQIGRAILLGLGFLVAPDIIRTVAVPIALESFAPSATRPPGPLRSRQPANSAACGAFLAVRAQTRANRTQTPRKEEPKMAQAKTKTGKSSGSTKSRSNGRKPNSSTSARKTRASSNGKPARKAPSSSSSSSRNGGSRTSKTPSRTAQSRLGDIADKAKVPAVAGGAALLGLAGGMAAGRKRASGGVATGLTKAAKGLGEVALEVRKVHRAVSDK